MNWELVKIFAEVCKDHSISKAAKRLGRSQSAVSQRIQNLEEQMQTKLINISGSKFTLTPEGNNFYTLAKGMAKQYEEWQLRTKFETTSHFESLEIEIGQTLATMWLPHYIDRFCEKNYQIPMRIKCVAEQEEYLRSYADISISTFLEKREDIIQEYLMTFHLGLYASPLYLKKYGTPKMMKDLVEHRLMSYSSGKFHQYGEEINDIFRQNYEYNSGCFLEINSGQSLVTLASKGHGIIALSKEYPGLSEANLVRIIPEIENEVDIYIGTPLMKRNKKSINTFKDFLHNELYQQKDTNKSQGKHYGS